MAAILSRPQCVDERTVVKENHFQLESKMCMSMSDSIVLDQWNTQTFRKYVTIGIDDDLETIQHQANDIIVGTA